MWMYRISLANFLQCGALRLQALTIRYLQEVLDSLDRLLVLELLGRPAEKTHKRESIRVRSFDQIIWLIEDIRLQRGNQLKTKSCLTFLSIYSHHVSSSTHRDKHVKHKINAWGDAKLLHGATLLQSRSAAIWWLKWKLQHPADKCLDMMTAS